jgi:pilus assembly protein TadC
MKEIKLFSKFGKAFIPKKLRPTLSSQFFKAGYIDVPYTLFGALFYLTLFLTYFIYFPNVFSMIKDMNPLAFLIVTFLFWTVVPLAFSAASMLGIYLYIDMKIYNRTKKMEEKLADYFTFVSTNLKGGMSFEKSLWTAIRPEFGLLAEEMGIVSKKVMTGSDLSDALEGFAKKYPSPIIKRSVNLITSEIESGGKISQLMDRVVSDLKKTKLLKQEMAASTLTYVIFISAIIIVISPILFALSFQLLQVMINFMGRFSSLSMQGMPFEFSGDGTIDPQKFKQFSFFAISIVSVFASMIVSIIQKGSIKSGLKYIPMYWFASIIVYVIAFNILSNVFSSMI